MTSYVPGLQKACEYGGNRLGVQATTLMVLMLTSLRSKQAISDIKESKFVAVRDGPR
jgi:hypothetical protein